MNEIQTTVIDTLTVEILILKQQTAQNIIEIGKRLIAAKEKLAHGEWGKYLEEKVDFSQPTANRFMKVANEFSNSSTLRNLSQSKVFALLSLPQEEREEFVQVNDIEAMSTRELQKTIKEKQDLEAKLKDSLEFNKKTHELVSLREKERDQAIKTIESAKKIAIEKSEEAKFLEDALQKEKENSQKTIYNLQKSIIETEKQLSEAKNSENDEEVTRLQASLKEIQGDLDSSALRIDELEAQLAKPIDVITAEPVIIEKIPEETQRELEELRSKNGQNTTQPVIKFKIYFEELQNVFRNELEVMAEIKKDYPETYEKCKSNISKLINQMSERL